MPTIVQALKLKGHGLSIPYGDRWLRWDYDEKKWSVRDKKKDLRRQLICLTPDQKIAVEFLLGKR